MRKLLTSSILLLALAGSVLSGMPMHQDKAGMMDCCDKARSKNNSQKASMARLCCAINCTESAPTSSGFSANFAPPAIDIKDSISRRLAEMFDTKTVEPSVTYSFEREALSGTSRDRFLQHHSFRI